MNVTVDTRGDSQVAVIDSDDVLIGDVQDALDLMATIQYNHGCHKMLIRKSNVTESFFDLSTRIAGDILQKYTNYRVKLAIVGSYEGYTSKSLRDFIYESNRGTQVFFLGTEKEALDALHQAG